MQIKKWDMTKKFYMFMNSRILIIKFIKFYYFIIDLSAEFIIIFLK